MSQEMSENLKALYRELVPHYLDLLRGHIEDGNRTAMQEVAHNIASALGTAGDLESCENFRAIETQPMSDSELRATLDQAEPLARRFVEEL